MCFLQHAVSAAYCQAGANRNLPPTTTRQRRQQIREYLRNATALPVLREQNRTVPHRGTYKCALRGMGEQQVSKRSGADVGGDKKWRATRTT